MDVTGRKEDCVTIAWTSITYSFRKSSKFTDRAVHAGLFVGGLQEGDANACKRGGLTMVANSAKAVVICLTMMTCSRIER